jgi:hypothetical protein
MPVRGPQRVFGGGLPDPADPDVQIIVSIHGAEFRIKYGSHCELLSQSVFGNNKVNVCSHELEYKLVVVVATLA